jgi:hypothetical protein
MRKFARPGRKGTEEHDKIRGNISSNYLKEGEISRGYAALQFKNHPTPPAEIVFEKLRDLHPPRPAESIIPDLPEDIPKLQLPATEVFDVIQTTKNSVTNCSITSFRYELIKLLTGRHRDPDEQDFLSSLTWIMNQLTIGNTPEDIGIILRSTQAVAIPKKDNNIRPLGLRDGLINLTTKCVLKHLQKDTIKTFYGINYALAGPKKMDELIALIAHAFRVKPDHDRLFIDCTNAFNKIDRAEAAKAIIATCPKLTRYFYFLYQKNTNIWARNSESSWNTITGSQGGTQGCVMAPMVFGFGSLNTYRRIDTQGPLPIWATINPFLILHILERIYMGLNGPRA